MSSQVNRIALEILGLKGTPRFEGLVPGEENRPAGGLAGKQNRFEDVFPGEQNRFRDVFPTETNLFGDVFPAEQNRKILFHEDGSPTARTESIMGHTPMGRFGEAEELIGATVFLASHQASSFVTGSDIRVDGGFLSQTI